MRQPAALYDIRHLLQAQLPHLPGRLRAVLALWVQAGHATGAERLSGCGDPGPGAGPHEVRATRTRYAAGSGSCGMTMPTALIPGVRTRSWR